MNTNTVTILAPFITAWHSPGGAFVVVPIIILAYMLDRWPKFNSQYVPVVCILLGTLLYPLFTPISAVPPGFPFPIAVLFAVGFGLGFISWIVHTYAVKALMDWLGKKAAALMGQSDTPPLPPSPDVPKPPTDKTP